MRAFWCSASMNSFGFALAEHSGALGVSPPMPMPPPPMPMPPDGSLVAEFALPSRFLRSCHTRRNHLCCVCFCSLFYVRGVRRRYSTRAAAEWLTEVAIFQVRSVMQSNSRSESGMERNKTERKAEGNERQMQTAERGAQPQVTADCGAVARQRRSLRRTRATGSAQICADCARRSRSTNTRAPLMKTPTSRRRRPFASHSSNRKCSTATRSPRPALGSAAGGAARQPADRSRTAARSAAGASTRVYWGPLKRTIIT